VREDSFLKPDKTSSGIQARLKNERRKRATTAIPSKLIIARARVDGSGMALALRATESKLVCDLLFPFSKISNGCPINPPDAGEVRLSVCKRNVPGVGF
jgi:hypothetical protein